jgi:hypothetical protein
MDFEGRQMASKNKINKMKNIFEYIKVFLFSFTNYFFKYSIKTLISLRMINNINPLLIFFFSNQNITTKPNKKIFPFCK